MQDLSFKKVDIDRIEKKEGGRLVLANLQIENPNRVGLKAKSANLELRNGPLSLGTCALVGKPKLPAKQLALVPIQLDVQSDALVLGGIQQLGKLISGGKAGLEIKGEIKVCALGVFCKTYDVDEELKLKL